MTTRKFWCHYIGRDGNTPKRRSIELHNLADLIPMLGDNKKCETPLWYEEVDEHYETYVQLSDKVALSTLCDGIIGKESLERLMKTDAEFDAEFAEKIKVFVDDDPLQNLTEEQKEQNRQSYHRWCEEEKQSRDRYLAKIRAMQDYTSMLLNGYWIAGCAIKAYEEVGSPYLPVFKELRRRELEKREEDNRQEALERERERKEEARLEAERKEREEYRLTCEAKKFKNGEYINGEDVVSLCRRYGIKVHLRTIHNLQKVVSDINGSTSECHVGWDMLTRTGRCKANLDGCWKAAQALYDYLQTHDNLEAA